MDIMCVSNCGRLWSLRVDGEVAMLPSRIHFLIVNLHGNDFTIPKEHLVIEVNNDRYFFFL